MNIRYDVDKVLPPKSNDTYYSNQVVVYYEAKPDLDLVERWGIAYFHYYQFPIPEHEGIGEWIDHCCSRVPTYWWDLPEINNI